MLFNQLDKALLLQGRILEAAGFGPEESAFRAALDRPAFNLRDYGGPENGHIVLLISAPIKKVYIWDLLPEASAIRCLLQGGARVYAMEWKPPSEDMQDLGLKEYAGDFISEAIAQIRKDTGNKDPVFLAGHSLGGTLAAIFSSLHPEELKGLVLAASPLHFGEGIGSLDTAVALFGGIPDIMGVQGNVPGAYLDVVASGADPETFVFYPLGDLVRSFPDLEAFRTHFAVRRWMLDETPLPKRLFREVVEFLYKDDMFFKGTLKVGGQSADPSIIDLPILAIVDRDCRIVTPSSVLPFLEKTKSPDARVLWYPGDDGILFRHAGVLVGRNAIAYIWPEVASWLETKIEAKSPH